MPVPPRSLPPRGFPGAVNHSLDVGSTAGPPAEMSGGAEDSVQGELEEERAAGRGGDSGMSPAPAAVGSRRARDEQERSTWSGTRTGDGRGFGLVGGVLPRERGLPPPPWHPRGPPEPAEPHLKRNHENSLETALRRRASARSDGRVPRSDGRVCRCFVLCLYSGTETELYGNICHYN